MFFSDKIQPVFQISAKSVDVFIMKMILRTVRQGVTLISLFITQYPLHKRRNKTKQETKREENVVYTRPLSRTPRN